MKNETKICGMCKEEKNLSDFYKETGNKKDGHQFYCSDCKKRDINERKAKNNPVKQKENKIVGYVYIVEDNNNNRVTIGSSKNPKETIKNIIFECGLTKPRKFTSKELIDMNSVEKNVYENFSKKKIIFLENGLIQIILR